MTRWICLLLLVTTCLAQDDLDDFSLEERPSLTDAQAVERWQQIDAMSDPTARADALLKLYDDLAAHPETIMPPRAWALFTERLAFEASPHELRQRVQSLLDNSLSMENGPAAARSLNLGLQLAASVGGASPEQLQDILRKQPAADRQWLLPALGRAAGKDVLPQLQSYRRDEVIIPLNNAQNIRLEPCAAVLACAYAGDRQAHAMVLDWYESDYADRSRFAYYVQWSIQQGEQADYRLLDYCNRRFTQVESYLNSLPTASLDGLITHANEDFAVALADYLVRRLKREPSAIAAYLPLLDSPSAAIATTVFEICLATDDASIRDHAVQQMQRHLSSRYASQRFLAAVLLKRHKPEVVDWKHLRDNDPSPEVRYRLQDLVNDFPELRP